MTSPQNYHTDIILLGNERSRYGFREPIREPYAPSLSYDRRSLWLRAICTGQDNCLIDIAMLFIFMISTSFAHESGNVFGVQPTKHRLTITLNVLCAPCIPSKI